MSVNPKLINKAADVIKASMARGNREAFSLAVDLDSAGLLQAPTAGEELETAKGDFAAQALETTATRIERRGRRLGGEWIRTDQVVAVMREIAAARDFTDPAAEKGDAR